MTPAAIESAVAALKDRRNAYLADGNHTQAREAQAELDALRAAAPAADAGPLVLA